ncbi:MAG: hypothetical protein QOI42_1024 [Frankiaceae bacterium]|nr:hypothetical protein [Frankiaceae bacterium]
MLKGDLQTTPLPVALRELTAEEATGCLHVIDMGGEEALVYVKAGLIYAVQVPGRRPSLGSRLVSSNALTPEALSEALDAQRNDLQGWRLGELLVHMGFVDQPVVEAFVTEQVRDAMSELLRWQAGRWRFRKAEKTREDVAPPVHLEELLAEVERRNREWEDLAGVVHGPGAVVLLSTRGAADPTVILDADSWALLCKVDNERTIAELARECGFTLFEAGQVVYALVRACLVDVEEELSTDSTPAVTAAPPDLARAARAVAAALTLPGASDGPYDDRQHSRSIDTAAGGDQDDELPVAARLIGALGALPPHPAEAQSPQTLATDNPESARSPHDFGAIAAMVSAATSAGDLVQPSVPLLPPDLPAATLSPRTATGPGFDTDGEFDASIARVSAALSDLLGPQDASYDPFDSPSHPTRKKATADTPDRPKLSPSELARRERLRAAAAAELAAAHAIAEAHKRGEDVDEAAAMAQHVAPVVDLDTVRRESERRAAEAAAQAEQAVAERQAAAEAAARAEVESARAEEAAAAERIAAEADAWRQHELWLYAERLQSEDVAWQEHAQWLATERAGAEEEAYAEHGGRLARERADAEAFAWAEHAEWLAAERAAVEPTAWLEHAEWLAALRLGAEASAWAEHVVWLTNARTAAEAVAWLDHEEWLAQERRDAESEAYAAHADYIAAERDAAEDEARAEYAVRAAAELAARRQAEDEARRAELEARRRADEEARLAAAEAARAAADAEAEAQRLAEQEAQRLAEEEAQRHAAAEAQRLADEEAARVAAAEAQRLADEEAARVAAEAQRLADEEAARVAVEAEAARVAAEAEAEAQRLAQEEAARAAAEAEAARIAAEAEAQRLAQEEAARAAAEAEAARIAAEQQARADQSELEALAAGLVPTAAEPVWENSPAPAAYDDAFSPVYGEESAFLATETNDGGRAVPAFNEIDTAVLLRELSSLGDEEPSAPRPAPPSRPPAQSAAAAAAANKDKKRKGLFGR